MNEDDLWMKTIYEWRRSMNEDDLWMKMIWTISGNECDQMRPNESTMKRNENKSIDFVNFVMAWGSHSSSFEILIFDVS